MKIKLIACFILISFIVKGQSDDNVQRFKNILTDLYQTDSVFKKHVDESSMDDNRSHYCDSALMGKFPLILTKGGKAWFDRFAVLKSRVKFTKNLSDKILDLDKYYEAEIKTLDYDSIYVGSRFEENDTTSIPGQVIEGFYREWYKFFKAGTEIRLITLNFLGGRQLYSWREERNSNQTYTIIIPLDN